MKSTSGRTAPGVNGDLERVRDIRIRRVAALWQACLCVWTFASRVVAEGTEEDGNLGAMSDQKEHNYALEDVMADEENEILLEDLEGKNDEWGEEPPLLGPGCQQMWNGKGCSPDTLQQILNPENPNAARFLETEADNNPVTEGISPSSPNSRSSASLPPPSMNIVPTPTSPPQISRPLLVPVFPPIPSNVWQYSPSRQPAAPTPRSTVPKLQLPEPMPFSSQRFPPRRKTVTLPPRSLRKPRKFKKVRKVRNKRSKEICRPNCLSCERSKPTGPKKKLICKESKIEKRNPRELAKEKKYGYLKTFLFMKFSDRKLETQKQVGSSRVY
ncbi:hypothetical protein E2C01_032479 [Portunus trituberculatus]|uniref:Uncharacterized protein n=1 Tax=Portunus trituberculatus TaxID=210409 RepID=A0A5B7EVD4_PORTR|nr:hypothetical protein [Portunus trituberculatus]